MFVSLQLSTGSPATIPATIEAEMAGGTAAVCVAFLDDSELLSLLLLLLSVTARRPGAARRRLWRLCVMCQ